MSFVNCFGNGLNKNFAYRFQDNDATIIIARGLKSFCLRVLREESHQYSRVVHEFFSICLLSDQVWQMETFHPSPICNGSIGILS